MYLRPRPGDLRPDDWTLMFDAVKARLYSSVCPGNTLASAPARVQVTVLECVQALDQLQSVMLEELARRQGLLLLQFGDAGTNPARLQFEPAAAGDITLPNGKAAYRPD